MSLDRSAQVGLDTLSYSLRSELVPIGEADTAFGRMTIAALVMLLAEPEGADAHLRRLPPQELAAIRAIAGRAGARFAALRTLGDRIQAEREERTA